MDHCEQVGSYRYRLSSTGGSSSKYGLCEICGKHASEVFQQSEEQAYVDDGRIAWTQHGCRRLFGHEDCLIGHRRKDGGGSRTILREQADRHRAARGLTPDQRHFVAATLWQWWTVGGPHRQIVASLVGGEKLRQLGDRIDEGSARYPELIRVTAQAVRDRIERFRARRATPRLILTAGGPRFVVREYDHWGQFRGEKEVFPAPSSRAVDWLPWLERRRRWDATDIVIARGVIRNARRPEDVPTWLRDAIREWDRIDKRRTLVPTPSERQRYRKAAGLVKSRKAKVTA